MTVHVHVWRTAPVRILDDGENVDTAFYQRCECGAWRTGHGPAQETDEG